VITFLLVWAQSSRVTTTAELLNDKSNLNESGGLTIISELAQSFQTQRRLGLPR